MKLYDNKQVLVTGAAGFIGSHLVQGLVAEGASVRAMVRYNSTGSVGFLDELSPQEREKVEIVHGDIRDPNFVKTSVADMQCVFHLAALIGIPYSYQAPESYVDVNIRGTLNVLQACMEHQTPRMVQTSTSEVYGTGQYVPMDEKHPLCPQSPYAATKVGADKLVESYHCSFELPAVVVRPFNTFGPRQSRRAVIPTVCEQALRGGPIHLGDTSPVRDFMFVKDTVRGFMMAGASEKAIGRTISLGTGRGVTIGEMAEMVAKLCDQKVEVTHDPKRVRPKGSEVRRLISDASLAKELMGWEAQYSLEDGLREVLKWLSANPSVDPFAYAV